MQEIVKNLPQSFAHGTSGELGGIPSTVGSGHSPSSFDDSGEQYGDSSNGSGAHQKHGPASHPALPETGPSTNGQANDLGDPDTASISPEEIRLNVAFVQAMEQRFQSEQQQPGGASDGSQKGIGFNPVDAAQRFVTPAADTGGLPVLTFKPQPPPLNGNTDTIIGMASASLGADKISEIVSGINALAKQLQAQCAINCRIHNHAGTPLSSLGPLVDESRVRKEIGIAVNARLANDPNLAALSQKEFEEKLRQYQWEAEQNALAKLEERRRSLSLGQRGLPHGSGMVPMLFSGHVHTGNCCGSHTGGSIFAIDVESIEHALPLALKQESAAEKERAARRGKHRR
jgi:hypothetical protein